MKQILLILFCLIFAACSTIEPVKQNTKTEPVKTNPAEAVKFSVEKTEVKAGNAVEAIVRLKIQPPFHVNSNPPSEDNLIPTSIEFETKNGLKIEKPIYPAGEAKKFQFSEKLLSVYEGDVEIKLQIKADANAVRGEQSLNGKLHFQPCDEEVCYRPQTADVVLPVKIS